MIKIGMAINMFSKKITTVSQGFGSESFFFKDLDFCWYCREHSDKAVLFYHRFVASFFCNQM